VKISAPTTMPLLEVLALLSPGSSKTSLRSWVKEGRVGVGGIVVSRVDIEVPQGEVVELGTKVRVLPHGLKIIYQDAYLIVVDKPAGLLTVKTAFEKEETVHAILKQKLEKRVTVLHRLDRETSGALVFAFDERTALNFKALFEKHAIEREYIAIVEGKVEVPSGTWDCYLAEDAQYHVYPTYNEEEGKRAITHFEVTGGRKGYTRLKLRLETGRKNQIRVHCQQAGHSVAGDAKYGATTNPIKRVALHARFLGFTHPVTGKKITCVSSVPIEFDQLVREK